MLKNIVKAFIRTVSKLIDDILLVIGIILLAVGVFRIFVPAGYIVLGICCIAFAFFIARKGG